MSDEDGPGPAVAAGLSLDSRGRRKAIVKQKQHEQAELGKIAIGVADQYEALTSGRSLCIKLFSNIGMKVARTTLEQAGTP